MIKSLLEAGGREKHLLRILNDETQAKLSLLRKHDFVMFDHLLGSAQLLLSME